MLLKCNIPLMTKWMNQFRLISKFKKHGQRVIYVWRFINSVKSFASLQPSIRIIVSSQANLRFDALPETPFDIGLTVTESGLFHLVGRFDKLNSTSAPATVNHSHTHKHVLSLQLKRTFSNILHAQDISFLHKPRLQHAVWHTQNCINSVHTFRKNTVSIQHSTRAHARTRPFSHHTQANNERRILYGIITLE